jgi:hypothetical protein
MAKGEISIDASSLNKVAAGLKELEKQIPAAAYSAINRTVDFVSNNVGKFVAEEYNVKASEFKAGKNGIVNTRKTYASKGNLDAKITYAGRRLTFTHFALTPKIPNTGRQVKVKIKKGSGKKDVNTFPTAFIAPTGANSTDKVQFNAFKRKGKTRNPIEVLNTLSAPQMISNENVQKNINEMANSQLLKRIEHEIEYRLNKIKVK